MTEPSTPKRQRTPGITSLSVCPKPAMSELVFSTLKFLALCWSCEEEKVFLVMLLLGQEGGLGRVQLCLEEVDMFCLTIGWEEALSVTPAWLRILRMK